MKRTLLSSAIAAVMFATCLAWACFTGGQASAQAPMGAQPCKARAALPWSTSTTSSRSTSACRPQLKDLQAEAEKVQKDFERQLQDLQAQGQALSTA